MLKRRYFLICAVCIALLLLSLPRPHVQKRTHATFFVFDRTIVGSYMVNQQQLKRFQSWEPKLRFPCTDHDTYEAVEDVCTVGGLEGKLTVGFTGVNHLGQAVDAYEHSQLKLKPYRDSDRFTVQYVTLWVRCEFPLPPPRGVPLQVLGQEFTVDSTRAKEIRPGSVGICGRAPFGEQVDVQYWLDFYRTNWNVRDIVLYDVGLTEPVDHNDVVDLFPFLRKHYQSLAHDVLYLSWAMGQNWLRLDCELRMRQRGVDWVFSPDFDELLFPPRGKPFTSLESYLEKYKEYDWLSVGSLMSTVPVPCNISMPEFVYQEQLAHYAEWRNSDSRGPFECSKDFYDTRICPAHKGRRKLLVRNSEKHAFGQVEIHQLWSCAYNAANEREFGMDLNAEFTPYIRHYRSLNYHKCN